MSLFLPLCACCVLGYQQVTKPEECAENKGQEADLSFRNWSRSRTKWEVACLRENVSAIN